MNINVTQSLGSNLKELYNLKPNKTEKLPSSWSMEDVKQGLDRAVQINSYRERRQAELPARLADLQADYEAQLQILSEQNGEVTVEQEQNLTDLNRKISSYSRQIESYNRLEENGGGDIYLKVISARSGMDIETVQEMFRNRLNLES